MKSISLANLSLIRRHDAQYWFRLFPCFVVLEDIHNNPIYVTNTQDSHCSLLQYEDINEIQCSDTIFGVKVIGKFPEQTVEKELRNEWVVLNHYRVVLKSLVWIGEHIELLFNSNCNFEQFSQYNIPIFEFNDGFYMLPQHAVFFKVEPRKQQQQQKHEMLVKKSFSFNGMLKINKIMQYISQVKQETTKFAEYISENYEITGEEQKYFQECIEKYRERIRRLKDTLETLSGELNAISNNDYDETSSLTSLSMSMLANDDYGSEYSIFAQDKTKLRSLQAKKLSQFFNIISHLKLSEFINLDEAKETENPFFIELKPVFFEKVIASCNSENNSTNSSNVSTESINSQLGYYLLIIKVLSQNILMVPLPYKLLFMGSASMVEDELPLYTQTKQNQEHNTKLQQAILKFNMNINQLKQYMEHHR